MGIIVGLFIHLGLKGVPIVMEGEEVEEVNIHTTTSKKNKKWKRNNVTISFYYRYM